MLVQDILKQNVDFTKLFNLVTAVNNDIKLNERGNRFDKGSLIEQAFAEFSNNRVKHVDEQGYDCVLDNNIKIEMKFVKSILVTLKGNYKKKNTAKIKFTNTLGENKENINIYCDYLVMIDLHTVSIVDKQTIINNIKSVKDGTVVQFDINDVTILSKIQESNITTPEHKTYTEQKSNLMKQYIQQF